MEELVELVEKLVEQLEQEEELLELVEQMEELVRELDFQSRTSSSRWTAVARVLGSFLKTQKRELKMIKRGFQGQGGTFGETC